MSDKYDVVIIGAGISGLVAGNYLAKAGLKVLITEHHYALGGCCSYFKRKGFNFDCGAHSLGSFRLGGQFDRVFKELGIINKIEIKRAPISDTILTKKIRLDFVRNIDETIESISKIFPHDRNTVRNFLEEVDNFDTTNPKKSIDYYSKYKSFTFRNVLDSFFDSEELKSLLCVFLANLGLPSTQLAALPGLAMLKEFVLDGGYYVDGGMQNFVEFLANNYKERGGELLLRNKANKIILKNGAVQGIDTEKKGFIQSDCIVSTTGLKQTFLELIERQFLPENLVSRLPQLKSSVSGIIMYLGVKKSPINTEGWGRALWYVPENNADKIFGKVFNGELDSEAEVLLLTFPSYYDRSMSPEGCDSVSLFLTAPYKSPDYWKSEKAGIREKILHRAEEIIPGLSEILVLEEFATPPTFVKYTLNDDGAMYGLASTPSQFKSTIMPQQTSINGLYLASHWATVGVGQGGTPMAAFAGRQVARLIETRKLNKKDVAWVA